MNPLYRSEEYINDIKNAISLVNDFKKLQRKNILITGATGLIGSFLTEMICVWNSIITEDSRIGIIATGRNIEKLKDRFDGVPGGEFLRFAQWDLMAPAPFFNESIDYIIHGAGNAHPAAFAKDPVGTIMGNTYGTYNLLEYARMNSIKRLLYISSGEVYGEAKFETLSFKESDYGYIDILNPRSCYPTAKRTAENLCTAYNKQYGIDVVIARPCHTYGPNVTNTDNRATVQFTKQAINHESIVLKSLGLQIRSYCYIVDCATAIFTILLKGECCEAYNIAKSYTYLSIAQFAQLTADLADVALVYDLGDEEVNEQRTFITRAVLSSEKLEALGWLGRYDARTGIQHTLNIMKK